MLIEIWERLRGYDKWIETQATIKASEVEEVVVGHTRDGDLPICEWRGNEEIVWIDQLGREQGADFSVPEDSPLFQLVGGETVTIRYNPTYPQQFYYRELLRAKVSTAAKLAFLPALVISYLVVLVTLSIAAHLSGR